MSPKAAENQASESGKPAHLAGRKVSRNQVKRSLKDHCLKFVHGHFDTLLEELDSTLFHQAENSASNADQAQFLEAMTTLRYRRSAILKAVWAEFSCCYDRFFAGESPASARNQSLSVDDLELVDQAEWEEDLAISILASRAESANAQALWALNQRLAVLTGSGCKDSSENPLGPATIARALQIAIAPQDITEKAKTSVYEQFNNSVLAKVGEFLREANELLASKGILPDLKYSLAKTANVSDQGGSESAANTEGEQEAAPMRRRAEDKLVSSPEQWNESLRSEQRLLDALLGLQLQNLAISSTGITRAGVPLGGLFASDSRHSNNFNHTDYVTVLNNLQEAHKVELKEGGVVAVPSVMEFQKEFVGGLNEYAAETNNDDKKVPAADASTIDLVGTIFNQLLEDDSLCDKVKTLLSHLHTPYLKIALIDRSFLQEADHPARMLLNELAESGAYWITEDEDKFKVYDKIYQVVQRIVDDFDQDMDFIDQLREDFDNFIERVQKRVELAEKRSSQAEEGLDKLDVAKKKSLELFHRRAEAKNIPLAAQDILEQTWVDFLVFVYLRFGSDSETWKKAVLMLNQAFVRVHAALLTGDDELTSADVEAELTEERHTDSAQQAIQQIDAQLRTDILDLGYAEQDVSNMFELIEKASSVRPEDEWRAKYVNQEIEKPKNIVHGLDIGAEEVDESLESDIKLDFEVSKLEDDLDDQEQQLREKLRNVAYGTWFEWLSAEGAVERKLKLAWYSSMSDNYMFVNQAGVKEMVESLNNLTRMVHRGKVRVININNESFMERLFKRMVNNMQTSA